MSENKFLSPDINTIDKLSTTLYNLNIELEKKNALLEESQKARQQILENISHDLRAPVLAIRSAVDRLRKESTDANESAKLLHVVDRRLSFLEKLIGELYLSQKISQPEFSLELKPLKVLPFIEEYYIQLEISGRLEDRVSHLVLPNTDNIEVNLDTEHFLRVLDNIITNSINHTHSKDVITIGLSYHNDYVVIRISDTGSGISEENLPFIFERTFTTSKARTPEKTGSGLGLSIAKTIVEKHGGTISCTSKYGKGTSFCISLPIAKST